MLDLDDGDILSRLGGIVGQFKCAIELPPSWGEFAERRAGFSVVPNDKRVYPRRSHFSVAALEYRQTAPALPRPSEWHKIYTTDVSRGGIAFLHSEQLYPRERMRIVVSGDGLLSRFGHRNDFFLEVARCRRLKFRCYEIGGFFVESLLHPETRP